MQRKGPVEEQHAVDCVAALGRRVLLAPELQRLRAVHRLEKRRREYLGRRSGGADSCSSAGGPAAARWPARYSAPPCRRRRPAVRARAVGEHRLEAAHGAAPTERAGSARRAAASRSASCPAKSSSPPSPASKPRDARSSRQPSRSGRRRRVEELPNGSSVARSSGGDHLEHLVGRQVVLVGLEPEMARPRCARTPSRRSRRP